MEPCDGGGEIAPQAGKFGDFTWICLYSRVLTYL
jgi:hypothetical protein